MSWPSRLPAPRNGASGYVASPSTCSGWTPASTMAARQASSASTPKGFVELRVSSEYPTPTIAVLPLPIHMESPVLFTLRLFLFVVWESAEPRASASGTLSIPYPLPHGRGSDTLNRPELWQQ